MERYRALLIIIILALLVRSVFVGTYFTGDAIDTVGPARNFAEIGRAAVYATNENDILPVAYIEDGLYFNFTHPPMKTLLYSAWAALFGFNALMILLPIIFGLLSIVFIYLLGSHLYSEKVGLTSALIAALLRYHFYSSTLAFGDNFLMMTVAASVYFLFRYLDGNRLYAVPFVIVTALGFLTKFSAVTTIPVFLALAYLMKEKARFGISFLVIAAAVAVSFLAVFISYPITEALTGVSNQDFNFFDSYARTFFLAGRGYQDLAYEKAFYASSFAWQMTPFFAALLLLALVRLKRDKHYFILASWLILTFLIGFASSGQDFQRLMVIAVSPAIILAAKYISDLNWKKERLYILFGAAASFLLAFLSGLNDMLPYYSPSVVAFFFILAGVFIFMPKNRQLLLGASIGFSIFFLIGTNFLVMASSSAAAQLTDAVREREYPYAELWTDRDISLYLAPDGAPSFLQRPVLNEEFLLENKVKFLAFYSLYEENKISKISKLCKDEPFFAVVNGRKAGLACAL